MIDLANLRDPSISPELFSSGDTSQSCWQSDSTGCFNGAGAFQLRRPGLGLSKESEMRELQWGRSFSAPETREQLPENGIDPIASMGPELFSSGDRRVS